MFAARETLHGSCGVGCRGPSCGWILHGRIGIDLLMPIDREVLEAIREMEEPELRRLFMLTRARLERKGHDFPGLGPGINRLRKKIRQLRCR